MPQLSFSLVFHCFYAIYILITPLSFNSLCRYDTLECTHSSAVECHERDSKAMKNKYDATIEFMKQEHELADAKVILG